jgi:hypothetical protein
LTHFEPLSPTAPSSSGGVFNFIGRLFRTEAETSAPSSNNSDSTSQSAEGQNAVLEEVPVQVELPNDLKKVPNGATGRCCRESKQSNIALQDMKVIQVVGEREDGSAIH